MSDTPQKEAALLAALEIEKIVKKHNMPMIMIMGCPITGESVRSSYKIGGEKGKNNREYMIEVLADYITKLQLMD